MTLSSGRASLKPYNCSDAPDIAVVLVDGSQSGIADPSDLGEFAPIGQRMEDVWLDPLELCRPLNPHVIWRSPFTTLVPGVEHTPRLDQEELNLVLGIRLVLNALGDHEHFASRHLNGAITKVNA